MLHLTICGNLICRLKNSKCLLKMVLSLLPPGLFICLNQDPDSFILFFQSSCLLLYDAETELSLLEAWLMSAWLRNEEQCFPSRVSGTLVRSRNAIRSQTWVGKKMRSSYWQRDDPGLRSCRVLDTSGLTAVLDYQPVINVHLSLSCALILVQAISLALALVSSCCVAASGAFLFVFCGVGVWGFCVCMGSGFLYQCSDIPVTKKDDGGIFYAFISKVEKNGSVHMFLTGILRNF